jgi:hypothetical protein
MIDSLKYILADCILIVIIFFVLLGIHKITK